MNREWVLHNLREAEQELRQTIAEIESTADYGYGEFVVAMSHAYHHLNTAWNSRDEAEAVVRECSAENFERWRQFPNDIYMGSK
jgi:hypothetical protein